MSVDVDNMSMPDFLMLLRYEGKPPPGPEFDSIRMTPEEWAAAFPGLVKPEGDGEESDVADTAPAPEPAVPEPAAAAH